MVNRVNGSIVDSGAYLLFYRRRSEIPLGGPRFRQILEQFEDDDSSESEVTNSGEGLRLDEGSSQTGSSSALQGAGATRQRGKAGGNSGTDEWGIPVIRTVDDILNANVSPVHDSIEDEGIDVDGDTTTMTGFQPLTGGNSWSFDNLESHGGRASPFDSGAASDEAQHDSSGDERVHSPRDIFDHELIDPELLAYDLAQQPDISPPSYNEPPPPDYQGEITRDDLSQMWSGKAKVYAVPPDGAEDARSEEAVAEIHLDDQDKNKLG